MLTRGVGLALIGCVAIGGLGVAQQLQPRAYPIPERVESFLYQSPTMGRRYALNVGVPAEFKQGEQTRYPALLVMDGDRAFPAVNDAVRTSRAVIEPIFVVSIGTPQEDGPQAYSGRRQYEFSPEGWDRTDPFGRYVTNACADAHVPQDMCTGGAPKFLNAIVKEMLPLLEAKFPIDPERLGLCGGSAGGFFAAWASVTHRRIRT